MTNLSRISIVVALLVVVGAVLAVKSRERRMDKNTLPAESTAGTTAPALPAEPATRPALPRLVDLGAGKCIPCKMMAPILEELKKEYAGRLEVTFIDVWQNPEAGEPYKISTIPTQIFFDASGKERFRHEGFFAKKDILAKWKDLGVGFTPQAETGPARK